MKKKLVVIIVTAVSCLQISWGTQDATAFEKFAQDYAPPQDIIELVEKNKELILHIKERGALREIPGFFIKVADDCHGSSRLIHRVINAERVRRCIKRNKLNNLEVIKKYVYRLTGMWVMCGKDPVRLRGKWIVLAEKVNFTPQKLELSLEECQQLTLLAQKTLYRDWGFARELKPDHPYSGNNWVRNNKNGKLTCIDTEDRSFEAGTNVDISGSTCKEVLTYLQNSIKRNCTTKSKTRRWLRKYKRRNKNLVLGKSLNRSTEYDEDLDFEEVKREWVVVYKQCNADEQEALLDTDEKGVV